MRFHVLAADYDGTLAHHGRIDEPTWAALRKLRESGRKVVMVTGRELDELLSILPHPAVFDRIVAENGGVVYDPATKEAQLVCTPPPPELVAELLRRGVERVSCGRVIVATWEPHQDTVLHVIRDLGLELQVIFNKGAVMILPTSVNKATGLVQALGSMGLSKHNTVGVGDAENDHALLELCECGAAVANALPVLKKHADLVLEGDHGQGIIELIDRMIADDLESVPLPRHNIHLGKTADGQQISIDPYRANIMVCGTSGSGKSTLATGLLERFDKADYQFAIIDPEGDYGELEMSVALGSAKHAPDPKEILDVLRTPTENVSVNLLGLALDHRPEYFASLLPALLDQRSRTARPHWLIVDEVHHMLPASWEPGQDMAMRPHGTIFITVHPKLVAKSVINSIDTLIVIGEHVDETVRELCETRNIDVPVLAATGKLPTGQALYWQIGSPETQLVQTEPPKTERKRHVRKYAEGNLGKARSFYFKGPDGKLNLKAHNLQIFMLLAAGVDDETWEFHAKNHEYSAWIRNEVKDPELAQQVERLELHPNPSRDAIRAAIENKYTLPADRPSGIVDEEPDEAPSTRHATRYQ
ncbi:MAG: HAD-IIB family hydrolase [Deltaproteobacteria bacterium]|nr:HAD-IIB family hydrolase [Deltaproteobacteria bacterium]